MIGIQGTHVHIFHLVLVGICCNVMMSAKLIIARCALTGVSFCSKLKESILWQNLLSYRAHMHLSLSDDL